MATLATGAATVAALAPTTSRAIGPPRVVGTVAEQAGIARLDWRELAPPQETHSCDCGYCEMGGEPELAQWPFLVTFDLDGVRYVTDRYFAVRANLAPVPDGYEGPTQHIDQAPAGPLAGTPPLRTQARGLHFRWQVMRAVEAMGWQLRLLDHPEDATEAQQRLVAVFAADNETHIGWAMSAKRQDDDYWSSTFTREYGDDDE